MARTDYNAAAGYVSLADFNNDGILDIVYINGPQVLLGNGDGTFRPAPQSNIYGGNIGLALGDFNGDGNMDEVTGGTDATMQVGYGNGDGTFQGGPVIPIGVVPDTFTVADVNNDGLPDILVGTLGLLVFLNQGDGTFGPYTTLLGGDGELVLFTVAADLNGDGLTDIVVGTGSGAQVLLGTGGGNFIQGQTLKLQHAAGSMALVDMDADGKLDLVATGGNPIYDPTWTKVSILKGNGDGTFTNYSQVSMPLGVYGVKVGDLNGDGTPDLAMLQNSSEYQVAVAFNRGDGTFGKPVSYVSTNAAEEFAMGPLVKPGVNDLVIGGNFSYFMSVLLNEGTGTFQDGEHIALSPPPGPFAPGDFNGDGLTDFAVLTSSGVSIYENSGQGYGPYRLIHSYELASPLWVVAADFNKDGLLDLAVSLSGGGIAILLGQGAGQFAAPVTLASGSASMMVTGDFNHDGKVDIAATSNQIFFGNGDGTFASPKPLLAGSLFTKEPLLWLTPIQATQNKLTDLAVLVLPIDVNYNSFDMLLNNGDGTFRRGTSVTNACIAPCELSTGDFNGDGIPDLLVSGAGGSVYVDEGNGDGTFTYIYPAYCFPCSLTYGVSTIGDFNQDGKLDYAVASGVNLEVFLGNGDATFQDPFFVGISPGATFLEYLELQNTHSGPTFAFVASSGDGVDIDIQKTP